MQSVAEHPLCHVEAWMRGLICSLCTQTGRGSQISGCQTDFKWVFETIDLSCDLHISISWSGCLPLEWLQCCRGWPAFPRRGHWWSPNCWLWKTEAHLSTWRSEKAAFPHFPMMPQHLSPLFINASNFDRLLLIMQLQNNKKGKHFLLIVKHRHGDRGGGGLAEKEVFQWAKMSD